MRHFARIRDASVERWIDDLADVAIRTWTVPLTASERDLLIDDHWRRVTERPPLDDDVWAELLERLDARILAAADLSDTGAAFVRAGACAPLDSRTAQEDVYQVDCGLEAIEVLSESERVFDHLCLAQECAYEPAVVVRPWLELELELEREVRAELHDGEPVGLRLRHKREAQVPRPVADAVRHRLARVGDRFPAGDFAADFVVDEAGAAWLLDVSPTVPEPARVD